MESDLATTISNPIPNRPASNSTSPLPPASNSNATTPPTIILRWVAANCVALGQNCYAITTRRRQ